MKSCEAQGLMKLDILGLSTISVLMEAKRLIERRHSIPVVGKARRIRANPVMFEISGHASEWSDTLNFEKIPLDDHNVYANLSKGNTMGVFQLYTKTGTDIIKDIKPKEFEDLVAAVALNRPGPMDSGMTGNYILRRAGETWKKKHPIYEEITKDTYGLLIYQEQVMKVISRVAGMSESEAGRDQTDNRKEARQRELYSIPKEIYPWMRQEPYHVEGGGLGSVGGLSEVVSIWIQQKSLGRICPYCLLDGVVRHKLCD
jgi:DNA polymerase-3 subunit alpha